MSIIKEVKPLETKYYILDPNDIFNELKGTSFEDIPSKLNNLSEKLSHTVNQEIAIISGARTSLMIKLGLTGTRGITITVSGMDNDKDLKVDPMIINHGILIKIVPRKAVNGEFKVGEVSADKVDIWCALPDKKMFGDKNNFYKLA